MKYLILISLLVSSVASARPRLYFDMDMSQNIAPLTLYKDNKPIESDWGVFQLKETVKNYPKALDHIRTYEHNTKRAHIWLVSSMAVLLGGLFSKSEGFFTLVSLGGFGTSYYYYHKGRGHLARAMNIYNGDDKWETKIKNKVSMSYSFNF